MRTGEHVWVSNTFARTYIVEGPGGLVMIDSITNGEIHDALADFVRDGIDLSRLRALLLTHMHHDHSGGAAYVRATFGVPVVMHWLDAEPLAHHDALMTAASRKWTDTYDHVPACTVDHVVDHGDTLEVAGLTIGVVHLPGHTRGGVGYIIDGDLFSGDTMFAHGGVGWPDVQWGSNLTDFVASIKRIADLKPARILGGHGEVGAWSPAVTDAALRYLQMYLDTGLNLTSTFRAPFRADDAPRATIRPDGPREDPDVPTDVTGAAYIPLRTGPRGSGALRGMVRPLGELHGLILHGDRDVPITRPLAATMNLEHYCEEGRHGKFVPADRRCTERRRASGPDRDSLRAAPRVGGEVVGRVRVEPGAARRSARVHRHRLHVRVRARLPAVRGVHRELFLGRAHPVYRGGRRVLQTGDQTRRATVLPARRGRPPAGDGRPMGLPDRIVVPPRPIPRGERTTRRSPFIATTRRDGRSCRWWTGASARRSASTPSRTRRISRSSAAT